MTPIFITGGTGYIGKRLIRQLVAAGHDVTALVRKGSENKLPTGVRAIIGDPFDASSFQNWIPKGAAFVHLLGISRLFPRKKEDFHTVDLQSAKAAAEASLKAGVSHFIYVSAAMTEINRMKDYRDVRKEAEAFLLSKNLPCTFIRPWYVIGPGHYWPLLLFPLYRITQLMPSQKEKAKVLSFITITQLLNTLQKAIDTPPQRLRIFEINHIKKNSLPAI